MNPRKLKHGFRMIGGGIPYTVGHEDNDVPTFWLLFYFRWMRDPAELRVSTARGISDGSRSAGFYRGTAEADWEVHSLQTQGKLKRVLLPLNSGSQLGRVE